MSNEELKSQEFEEQIKTVAIAEFEKVKDMISATANILIAGNTGAGKSTLINSVFQFDKAKVGVGEPITQKIEKFSKPGMPICIYDTKGIEAKDYQNIKNDLIVLIESLNKKEDPNEQIHLALICIDEGVARIEDAQKDLIKMCKQYKIPSIIVLTKAKSSKKPSELHDFIKKNGNFEANDIIAVRAIAVEQEDDEGIKTLSPFGLNKLAETSYILIPEGQRNAFARAQKVSMDVKQEEIKKIINMASVAAGTIAATPIPFSSPLIIPIQIGMITKITMTYNISLTEMSVASLAASVVGCQAGNMIGKTIIGNLIKFIPGIGTTAGGLINASVAIAITKGLGELYNKILLELLNKSLEEGSKPIEVKDIVERFKIAWKEVL